MKYGCGKWVYGAFLLLARDAARRFAFGHNATAARRGSWRPLVLTWLQRRKQRPQSESRRSKTSQPALWFPQFHFHYTTHLREQKRGNRAPVSSAATVRRETQIVHQSHWTNVRSSEKEHRPLRIYRPLLPFYMRTNPEQKTAGSAGTPNLLQVSRLNRSTPALGDRRSMLSRGWSPLVLRTITNNEVHTELFQTQPRISEQWLQNLRVHQSHQAISGELRSRLHAQTAPRAKFDTTEELVWRRVKRRQIEAGEEESYQPSDSFQSRTLGTSLGQEVVKSAVAVQQPSPLPITKLDPGLMDRLTDDVIRRVEQRARIERQRRGL
jgi:hypothetical protein